MACLCSCAALGLTGSRSAHASEWASWYEQNRAGLVLSLPFDEGHGDSTKDAVSGKQAEIHGAQWVGGSSSVITFPADAEKVVSLPDPTPDRKEFTIEAWCKPAKADGGYLVLKKYAFGFPNFAGEGKASLYLRQNNEKDWGLLIAEMVEKDAWQHYLLTCDGKVVWIYRNGKHVEDRPLPAPLATSQEPVLIGSSGGWGTEHFAGEVGLVRILNGVLSADQVREEYQSLKEGRSPIDYKSTSIQVPGVYRLAREENHALRFDGHHAYVSVPHSDTQNPAEALTVGAWINPERVTPANIDEQGYILSKGSGNHAGYALTTYYQAGLAATVVTDKGPFEATAFNVLRQGEWQHVAFSWGDNVLRLYVDGRPVGDPVITKGRLLPLKEPLTVGKAADRNGLFFQGAIDDVRILNAVLVDKADQNLGQEIITAAANADPAGFIQPVSRFIAGTTEQHLPLVDFEDLTGWTVTTYKGISKAELFRSHEKALWGNYVAKVTFEGSRGQEQAKRSFVIRPPQPIAINSAFDAVALWVYGKYYYRPGGFTVSAQFEDAQGKARSVILDNRSGPYNDYHQVFWGGWSIAHCALPAEVKPPAKFLSLTFYGLVGESSQTAYIDSLSFYKINRDPIPCTVPSWKEVNFPTTPDTILPSLAKGVQFKNSIRREGDTITFLYDGNDESIEYQYRPDKGTLSDISTKFNKSFNFRPLVGGGLVLDVGGRQYSPDDSGVKRTLDSLTVKGDVVEAVWSFQVADTTFKARLGLQLKQKSLIVNLNADTGAVNEVRFGSAMGTPAPKLLEVPYLTMGGGMHKSEDPAILYTNGVFLSAFADWYNSEASELFGEKKLLSNESATINGGSAYYARTDGKRNAVGERFFLTASSKFAEALPNIPNPPSPYLNVTKKRVWAMQSWDLDAKAYADIVAGKAPPYYEQLYSFWEKMKQYGVDDLAVHFRIAVFQPGVHQSDTDDGFPESSYVDEDPLLGGNAAVKEFVRKMEGNLGYSAIPYTNYTITSPLNYRYWDENKIALYPDGQWKFGSGPALLIKPARALECEEYFDTRLKKEYNVSASYADQYTARPPWECTDYDARTPDAAKFSQVFRVYGKLLDQQRKHFGGPVFSEGLTQWLFAGLCDGDYAMLANIEQPLLVDFRLLKINPLTNDFGFHLRYYAGGDLQWWVASEIAYGSTGMAYGRSWLPPHDQRTAELLKSTFLIQQLQQQYAAVPVTEIRYNDGGRLVSTEEAIKTDAYKRNQVYRKHENGLQVYVNRNEKENWTVSCGGVEYILPPNGYLCELPGVILEYSALSGGRRVDFVRGAQYVYCDGGGQEKDFGPIVAAQCYVVKPDGESLWLIPAPFRKQDNVTLDLKILAPALAGAETVAVLPVAEDGTAAAAVASTVPAKGKVAFTVDGTAFKYRIVRKAAGTR